MSLIKSIKDWFTGRAAEAHDKDTQKAVDAIVNAGDKKPRVSRRVIGSCRYRGYGVLLASGKWASPWSLRLMMLRGARMENVPMFRAKV